MTNPLTGAFDVAAQLSVATINRVLAAQHQLSGDDQMYFHSVRIRVPAGESHGVEGIVDVQVSPPTISVPDGGPPVVLASATTATPLLLPTVNAPRLVRPGPVAPPWLPFPGGGSRVTIHFQVSARFRPGAASVAAPEFVHGEVLATVDAEQITSTSANVLTVDLGAADVVVSFLPAGDSSLSTAERDLVGEVVDGLVRSSFEPVNHVIELPAGTDEFAPYHWRFKTMPDDTTPGIAILLNMRQDRVPTDADRDAFDANALDAGDDFAVAAGSDFLVSTLRDLIRDQMEDQVVGAKTSFKRSYFGLKIVDVTYEIESAQEPVVELHPGVIRLSVSIAADGSGFPAPDVTVALTQDFTLAAVAGKVALQRVGDLGVDVDIAGGIAGWIASLFRGRIESKIGELAGDALDIVVSQAGPILEDMLSGLETLLEDVRIPAPELSYRAVEISRDGIIVRGDLAISGWDPVVVSFSSRTIAGPQLELDAFNSWIPGGTIERFEWRLGDGTTVQQVIDSGHQFIARPDSSGPARFSLWSRWCLEVSGTQDGGPVSASNCDLVGPPVVVITGNGEGGGNGAGDSLPIAVRDEVGLLLAHVDLSAPRPDGSGKAPAVWPANVLVHFAGSDPDATLALVNDALPPAEIDGGLFVVSVLEPGALERLRGTGPENLPGAAIVYAEDFEGAWARTFGGGGYGATYLLNPRQGIVWRSPEEPSARELATALASHTLAVPLPPPGRLRRTASEGDRAPDFLFDFGAGTTMALRTLRRSPVVINFFKSWSQPCRAELMRLRELAAKGWLVLAVSDGEKPEASERLIEELGLGFRVVADPERQIAGKYGIQAWPTTVTIDTNGTIRSIRTGLSPAEAPETYR